MAPAPDVCGLADTQANTMNNAVNTNAARLRWGQKFRAFIMGSPN
jgi:hypothetical protein